MHWCEAAYATLTCTTATAVAAAGFFWKIVGMLMNVDSAAAVWRMTPVQIWGWEQLWLDDVCLSPVCMSSATARQLPSSSGQCPTQSQHTKNMCSAQNKITHHLHTQFYYFNQKQSNKLKLLKLAHPSHIRCKYHMSCAHAIYIITSGIKKGGAHSGPQGVCMHRHMKP